MKRLLFLGVVSLLSGVMCVAARAGVEPQAPMGVSWGMTMEQIQRLPELEHAANNTLQHAYTIRGAAQTELVARWQGRAVSFHVANDFGLYAINIEMTPQSVQHTQVAADQELVDLEQCAPVRLAIRRKYGAPTGVATTWDTTEIAPLASTKQTASQDVTADSVKWPYARNWLLWEGQETRLALGEQSVWYASRLGLAKRERLKREWEKERELSLSRELERRAKRQQQLDEARDAVMSRANAVEASF